MEVEIIDISVAGETPQEILEENTDRQSFSVTNIGPLNPAIVMLTSAPTNGMQVKYLRPGQTIAYQDEDATTAVTAVCVGGTLLRVEERVA